MLTIGIVVFIIVMMFIYFYFGTRLAKKEDEMIEKHKEGDRSKYDN